MTSEKTIINKIRNKAFKTINNTKRSRVFTIIMVISLMVTLLIAQAAVSAHSSSAVETAATAKATAIEKAKATAIEKAKATAIEKAKATVKTATNASAKAAIAVNTSANTSANTAVNTSSNTTSKTKTDNTTTPNIIPNTIYPLKVKNAAGVYVTIPKKPGSIISLTLGTDEILLSIADLKRIIGLSKYADEPGLSNVIKEAAKIKERLDTNSVEKIVSLKPDLVFVADWTDAKFVKQLTDAGITVFSYVTPNGVEDTKKLVRLIARIIGEVGKGEKLYKGINDKLKGISDKVYRIPQEKRVTVLTLDSMNATYGKETTFDDLCKRAGVINVASKAGFIRWNQIDKEKIVQLNPDIIFLPAWSYPGFDAKKFAEEFRKDKSLSSVKAIKNKKVYTLFEGHLSCVSQYIAFGVEDIAKVAYPEKFK